MMEGTRSFETLLTCRNTTLRHDSGDLKFCMRFASVDTWPHSSVPCIEVLRNLWKN